MTCLWSFSKEEKKARKKAHARTPLEFTLFYWRHRVVVDSWSQLVTYRLSGLSNTLEATRCRRHKTIVGIWKRNFLTLTLLSVIQVCIFSNTWKFAETKPTDKLWHYRLLYDRVLAALVTLLLQVCFSYGWIWQNVCNSLSSIFAFRLHLHPRDCLLSILLKWESSRGLVFLFSSATGKFERVSSLSLSLHRLAPVEPQMFPN